MSEQTVELPRDEPPSSGEWVEFCDQSDLTPEEIEDGESLRELIDPDDDEDNGL